MADVNITTIITVVSTKEAEVIEYFVKNQGYLDTISGVSNPISRTSAMASYLLNFVKTQYLGYKLSVDVLSAQTAAVSYVNAVSFAVSITT